MKIDLLNKQDTNKTMHKPISKKSLKMNNEFLFLITKTATFNPRPQIISPSKSATFTASLQPYNKQDTSRHSENKTNKDY